MVEFLGFSQWLTQTLNLHTPLKFTIVYKSGISCDNLYASCPGGSSGETECISKQASPSYPETSATQGTVVSLPPKSPFKAQR